MTSGNDPDREIPDGDDFVVVATYLYADQALPAMCALRGFGLLCYLENENALRAVWHWNILCGGLRLMVPQESAGDAAEILGAGFSERDLLRENGEVEEDFIEAEAAMLVIQSGRARNRGRGRLFLVMLLAPSVEGLRLFYF